MSNARDALDLTLSRAPSLGGGRLLAIDGPAGSGKTTLAAEIAFLSGAPIVHLDDLYEGWGGLRTVHTQLDNLLLPLAAGLSGRYRRWDWPGDAWAETVVVPTAPLLILEGVGSGAATYADLITVLTWVEVPAELGRARGLERGGVGVAENWTRWVSDEQEVFDREGTRGRADLVLDGRTGSLLD